MFNRESLASNLIIMSLFIVVIILGSKVYTQNNTIESLKHDNLSLSIQSEFKKIEVPENCNLSSYDSRASKYQPQEAEERVLKAMVFGYVTGCVDVATSTMGEMPIPDYLSTFLAEFEIWANKTSL